MTPPTHLFSTEEIVQWARKLYQGEVLAVPTETVYGLVADSSNPLAISKIYDIKTRDRQVPLQIMVNGLEMAQQIGELSPKAYQVMETFCPGGLTFVVPRKPDAPVHPSHAPNQDTAGIRWPDHPLITSLIQHLGRPLAGSSANISGQPSPQNAHDVKAQLGSRVSEIIDGGAAREGVASTVIQEDSAHGLICLREGAIAFQSLLEVYQTA